MGRPGSDSNSASTSIDFIREISVFRTARMMKLAMFGRLGRAWPEMRFMMRGMIFGVRSVAITLCMLFALLYVFAIMCVQLSEDTDSGTSFFSAIPHAMWTL